MCSDSRTYEAVIINKPSLDCRSLRSWTRQETINNLGPVISTASRSRQKANTNFQAVKHKKIISPHIVILILCVIGRLPIKVSERKT